MLCARGSHKFNRKWLPRSLMAQPTRSGLFPSKSRTEFSCSGGIRAHSGSPNPFAAEFPLTTVLLIAAKRPFQTTEPENRITPVSHLRGLRVYRTCAAGSRRASSHPVGFVVVFEIPNRFENANRRP